MWFWNFTSFAGFTQCRDADNKFSRWLWLVLALSGYGLTLYTAALTINSFFKNEIHTNIQYKTGIGFKTKLNFPSVTICNSNRVHCGHLYDLIYSCTMVNVCILFLYCR